MSKVDFLTPVGRLVQGDPFEAQTKNMQGQPLMTQAGQPTQRFFVAVAFPKTDPDFPKFWEKLNGVGHAGFPQLGQIPPPWDPRCRFAWKLMDGDGMDDNNKPNANKPGFAGCWVVKFQSSFAPKCFFAGHYAPHEQMNDPRAIQRGFKVRIAGTMEPNGNAQKPGVYVNLGMVELVDNNPALIIQSGPDATAVFGASPMPAIAMGAQPAGMPAAQPMGTPMGMPAPIAMGAQPAGMPAAQPMGAQPAGMLPGQTLMPAAQPMGAPMGMPAMQAPQQPFTPPGGAPMGAPPNASYPGVPAVPMAVMPAPAQFLQGPQLTAAALAQFPGGTKAQWNAQGWTDDAMRAHGFLA